METGRGTGMLTVAIESPVFHFTHALSLLQKALRKDVKGSELFPRKPSQFDFFVDKIKNKNRHR